MGNTSRNQPALSLADRLIETAEDLFGCHGLDAVSLRQISLAAGTGNNYAVQYHFGDQAGLIRAIFEKRMPDIERHRAQLLAQLKAEQRLADTRALMDVLYLPLIEHRNSSGERAYARLALALQGAPNAQELVRETFPSMPIADHVLDLIARIHPDIPQALLLERQRLVSIMVLTSIFNRREPFEDRHDAVLIVNAIDMATAALTVPVSPPVHKLF